VAKNNFGQFLTFWGLLYCADALPMRAKFGALQQTHIYAYVPNFVSIVYSVALWRRKKTFCRFLDFGISWCRQLAATWKSWTRLHNYILPNTFMAKSYA